LFRFGIKDKALPQYVDGISINPKFKAILEFRLNGIITASINRGLGIFKLFITFEQAKSQILQLASRKQKSVHATQWK